MAEKNGISVFKRAGWLLLAAGIAIPLAVYVWQKPPSSSPANHSVSPGRFPKPRQEIQGFHFNGSVDGRPIVSIAARRFSIQKKKIGFFRFGLLNTAVFEEAEISFYTAAAETAAAKEKETLPTGGESNEISFAKVFSPQGLPALPAENVALVEMAPIAMRLHQGGRLITRVSAPAARLDLRRRSLRFRGGVEAHSGGRVLRTDELEFRPETAVFHAPSKYVVTTPEGTETGAGADMDVHLTLKR